MTPAAEPCGGVKLDCAGGCEGRGGSLSGIDPSCTPGTGIYQQAQAIAGEDAEAGFLDQPGPADRDMGRPAVVGTGPSSPRWSSWGQSASMLWLPDSMLACKFAFEQEQLC